MKGSSQECFKSSYACIKRLWRSPYYISINRLLFSYNRHCNPTQYEIVYQDPILDLKLFDGRTSSHIIVGSNSALLAVRHNIRILVWSHFIFSRCILTNPKRKSVSYQRQRIFSLLMGWGRQKIFTLLNYPQP